MATQLQAVFNLSRTGGGATAFPAEYGTISETMAPEVLELVTDWVVETAAGGG